jgi:hypothetical protein
MTVYGDFFSELGVRAMSLVGMNCYIATNKTASGYANEAPSRNAPTFLALSGI